ncbi:MAG: hypothetical protein ACOYKI_03265 [Sediminibacterium sp.]
MASRTISVKDFYNLFPSNRKIDTLPLIKVELIVEISFETFGQVQYTDENGRPRIKEFVGNRWLIEIFLKQTREIKFSVFVSNQFLQKGKYVTLIKKIDDEVVDKKEFQLSGDKLFEGWFKLG